MLNCKEVTRLVSESFDRNLSLRERFGLRLHMMMCSTCRLFRQLQHRIHTAIVTCGRRSHEQLASSDLGLPTDARSRLQSVVNSVINEESTD
ncbi:MAG: zf-HC2 domain-containing protein [Rhodopirellula sp.]|nr:zf-HC2 domain-containing protein [Rhodopirellula sp.]